MKVLKLIRIRSLTFRISKLNLCLCSMDWQLIGSNDPLNEKNGEEEQDYLECFLLSIRLSFHRM